MTEPASPRARPTPRGASTPSRILVAGAAASSGMLMVAAMASAANAQSGAPPAPPVVQRTVMIELAAPAPDSTTTSAPNGEVTVVREVRVIPAPAQDPVPAPAATQGS